MCRDCENARRRATLAKRKDDYNAKARERNRLLSAELVRADARAKARQKRNRDRLAHTGQKVSVLPCRRWLEAALAEHGTLQGVAFVAGLSERRLWQVLHTDGNVSFDTAEKLALVADATEELWAEVGEPGREGWSRTTGDRACKRCGSSEHAHYAKGYCRRCYRAVMRARRLGRPVTAPKAERWALRHDFCVECKRNTVPHRGRGLCDSCYQRWEVRAAERGVKVGTLLDDVYPMDFPQSQRLHLRSPSGRRSARV